MPHLNLKNVQKKEAVTVPEKVQKNCAKLEIFSKKILQFYFW